MERRFLCTLVLLPRGQSAPDMALGLVLLQHRLHLRVERAVIQRQALGQVLMYRGLADAELFRGGADGRPVFYEVKGQLPGPLFQILSDRAPLLYTFAAGLCIWRGGGVYAVRRRTKPHIPRDVRLCALFKERNWLAKSSVRPRPRCRYTGQSGRPGSSSPAGTAAPGGIAPSGSPPHWQTPCSRHRPARSTGGGCRRCRGRR